MNSNTVEHVSAEYDDLKSSTAAVVRDLKKIEERLAEISQKVYDVQDAVESIMAYSYQYNIKLMGIPQVKDSTSAEETAEICLKLFKELKANVNEYIYIYIYIYIFNCILDNFCGLFLSLARLRAIT